MSRIEILEFENAALLAKIEDLIAEKTELENNFHATLYMIEFIQFVNEIEKNFIFSYFNVDTDKIRYFYQLEGQVDSHTLERFNAIPEVITFKKILKSGDFNIVNDHRNLIAHPVKLPTLKKLEDDLNDLKNIIDNFDLDMRDAINGVHKVLPLIKPIFNYIDQWRPS